MPTFPDDPRGIEVGFAFGEPASADPTAISYETVSPGSDADDPGPVQGVVTITRGRIEDAPTTQATSIELRVRNEGGEFSPRNVSGSRWGTLRKGTPMQVGVDLFGFGATVLARAAVPSWNPVRRGPGIDQYLNLTALGVLSRLGRDRFVASPLRYAFSTNASVMAYWPLEVDSAYGSALPNQPAIVGPDDPSFSAPDLAGSNPILTLTAETALSGTIAGDFGTDWFFDWITKIDNAPSTRITLMDLSVSGGTATRWLLEMDSTTIYMTGFDSSGSTVYSDTTSNTALVGQGWMGLQMRASSGSGWDLGRYDFTTSSVLVVGGSEPALVAGSLTGFTMPAAADLDGVPLGHIGAFKFPQPDSIFLVADGPAAGYAGETAADRILRLCTQEGVAAHVSEGDTVRMGPQQTGTLLSLLRECEAADHGVLVERRDGRLGYDPRAGRYNAAVDLELAFGTEAGIGDVSDLMPIDDDRDLYNIVRVRRRNGSEATAEKIDGPAGTSETDGIGPRPLPTITLNLADDSSLPDHAGWLLRRVTVDEPRAVLALDLYANPGLADDWLVCDIGSRIQITGAPSEDFGPDTLDLILEGYKETIGPAQWLVIMYLEPYAPYDVGTYQDTDASGDVHRHDGNSSTTSADFDTEQSLPASLSVATSAGSLWTTRASEFPLVAKIRGRLATVTNITGTTSPQTFTISEIDPVGGTIPSGSDVHVARPAFYPL